MPWPAAFFRAASSLAFITIQDITGERFLCGNEVPGLRERGCLVSFFPQS